MSKILVIIDMQNDFVTGALRNEDAIKIVPNVVEKVRKAKEDGDIVLFTRDTHFANYLETQEGKNLPVEHCIKNTWGWEIIDELKGFVDDKGNSNRHPLPPFDKKTFGSLTLGKYIASLTNGANTFDKVEIIGICTDICVISNATIIKASCPEVLIEVDASCCAGVTPQAHKNALAAMESIQIKVTNKED